MNNDNEDESKKRRPVNSLTDPTMIDVDHAPDVDLLRRRAATYERGQLSDLAVARSRDSSNLNLQSIERNYLTTSLGDISIHSLEGPITQKDLSVFNSFEEIEAIGNLKSEVNVKEDQEVKYPASAASLEDGGDIEVKSKRSKIDWQAMYYNELSQRASAQASSQQSPAEDAKGYPKPLSGQNMEETGTAQFPKSGNDPTSLFHANERQGPESFGLLSLGASDWLSSQTAASDTSEHHNSNVLMGNYEDGLSGHPSIAIRSLGDSSALPISEGRSFCESRSEGDLQAGKISASRKDYQSSAESDSSHTSQGHILLKRSRKVEPIVKEYVELTDSDVVMGRGGRANHHPGNQFFLERVRERKSTYESCKLKSEKTRVAQSVVDLINHERKGRFLEQEKETGRWFIVSNKTARTKASQSLRDKHTPEARAEKRKKYGC